MGGGARLLHKRLYKKFECETVSAGIGSGICYSLYDTCYGGVNVHGHYEA